MKAQDIQRSQFPDDVYHEQADFRRKLRTFLFTSEQEARDAGITPQQYLLLLIIRGHGTYPYVTIGAIAEDLKLKQSTTSLLVDRAVRKGLLARVEDVQDRRRALVSLTEYGQQILDRILRANREHMAGLNAYLSGQAPAQGAE